MLVLTSQEDIPKFKYTASTESSITNNYNSIHNISKLNL